MLNQNAQGKFLIAAPELRDPNFTRSVVLVAEHNEQGAFGLVINRPAALEVAKLWEVISGTRVESHAKAHLGGPVESSAVFLLHSCDDLAGGADPIVPGVWLGNETGLFASLIEREAEIAKSALPGLVRPIYRAFCGYSGWGEGQLDSELESGSWIVQPATPELVFAVDAGAAVWCAALERQGGIYRLFARMPPNPELN